jgi:hypothetical protein
VKPRLLRSQNASQHCLNGRFLNASAGRPGVARSGPFRPVSFLRSPESGKIQGVYGPVRTSP